jgi:Tfp pilus assembly protein PilW
MGKIRAYTILEVLVVMVIGMIVVSISYTAFFIVNTQYKNFQSRNEKVRSVSLLNFLLTRDFSEANTITSISNGVRCNMRDKIVEYDLVVDFVVRTESQVSDTFNIKVSNLYKTFDELEITENGHLIETLTFESSEAGLKNHFIYTKTYGSDRLIQNELSVYFSDHD